MRFADGSIRMQRIPVAAQRADRKPAVVELLLKLFDRRRTLQHLEPAVRPAGIIPRAQFDGPHTQRRQLPQHIIERHLRQQGRENS